MDAAVSDILDLRDAAARGDALTPAEQSIVDTHSNSWMRPDAWAAMHTREYAELRISLVACPVCDAPKGKHCTADGVEQLFSVHGQRANAARELLG